MLDACVCEVIEVSLQATCGTYAICQQAAHTAPHPVVQLRLLVLQALSTVAGAVGLYQRCFAWLLRQSKAGRERRLHLAWCHVAPLHSSHRLRAEPTTHYPASTYFQQTQAQADQRVQLPLSRARPCAGLPIPPHTSTDPIH